MLSYPAPSLYFPPATHSMCLLSIRWWLVDVSRFMIRSLTVVDAFLGPFHARYTKPPSSSVSVSLVFTVSGEERNFMTTMTTMVAKDDMRKLGSLRWIDSMFLWTQVIHLSCLRPCAIVDATCVGTSSDYFHWLDLSMYTSYATSSATFVLDLSSLLLLSLLVLAVRSVEQVYHTLLVDPFS